MKITELSRASGIHRETIRYYEKIGLLPLPKRAENGYRLYSPQSVADLHFIKTCRTLGISIEEIKYLYQLKQSPQLDCQADIILAAHLGKIEQQIQQLRQIQQWLTQRIRTDSHSVSQCQAITALNKANAESYFGELCNTHSNSN